MMMKTKLLTLLMIGGLALTSLASTPTRVDRGPIRAQTFSFMDNTAKPAAAFADNRKEIHPRIQEAITKSLSAKGLTKVSSGADVLVGYLVIVTEGASTTAVDDY